MTLNFEVGVTHEGREPEASDPRRKTAKRADWCRPPGCHSESRLEATEDRPCLAGMSRIFRPRKGANDYEGSPLGFAG